MTNTFRIDWLSWYINDAETSYSKEHAFERHSDKALCGVRFPRNKKESMWGGEPCQRCIAKIEKGEIR